MNQAYYKKNIDYTTWKTEADKKFTTGFNKANFIEINNKTFNKNFWHIYAFQEWAEKPQTIDVFKENGKNGKFASEAKVSFQGFNPTPYRGDHVSLDIMPIFDITEFLTYTYGTPPKPIFSEVLEKIKKNLKTYSGNKGRLSHYIDKNYSNMGSAGSGLYFDILTLIAPVHEPFQDNDEKKRVVINKQLEKIFSDIGTMTYDPECLQKPYILHDKIHSILKPLNANTDESEYRTRQLLIEETAKMIIVFMQTVLLYTQTLNNELDPKNEIELNLISDPESSDVSDVESIIRLSKPSIKPLFIKSYTARENNLKPFISIQMLYFPKTQLLNDKGERIKDDKGENKKNSFEGEEGNFIKINNFQIPYNNIQSLEHNVKDHSITINMIDTEGIIGELLVQKMYSVSQNKANSGKNDSDGDPTQPYYFVIEYGWAGPSTEDEDELLEAGIFPKTATRGYIKSISSQFTPKGNEYTLTIEANDKENLSKFLNNSEILHISNKDELSVVIGLIALFLAIRGGEIPADVTDFQQLFDVIEGASIKKVSSNFYITGISDSDTFEKKKSKEIYELVTRLFGDIQYTEQIKTTIAEKAKKYKDKKGKEKIKVTESKETIDEKVTKYDNIKTLKEITFDAQNSLENLQKSCETEDFVINGWIAAIYLIWKMKRNFKKDLNNEFKIIDTTGLFDVFADDGKIDGTKFNNVIKNFNPFGLAPDKNKDFQLIVKTLCEQYKAKKYINAEYQLSSIIDVLPETVAETAASNLPNGAGKSVTLARTINKITFFTNQISTLFSSIRGLGKDCTLPGNLSICQASDGVDANLSVFDMKFNKGDSIQAEYKKRLYSDKFNLIFGNSNSDPNSDPDKKVDEIIKINKIDQVLPNKKLYILYLSYKINSQNISSLNCELSRKIYLFGRTIAQSYSLQPRIRPKTRNGNRQFFSQGNQQIFREGTGDIIEFTIDPIDIGTFNSLMISNKNKNNFISNEMVSNTNVGGMYENAAKYTRNYRDIDGNVNKHSIARDMARLDLNYQNQTTLKGSITILGEPYWSNLNVMMKSIFITVYYANGVRSSHTGLYFVSNATQSISDGKFTTRLEILRASTFLGGLGQIAKKSMVAG